MYENDFSFAPGEGRALKHLFFTSRRMAPAPKGIGNDIDSSNFRFAFAFAFGAVFAAGFAPTAFAAVA